MSIPIDTTGLGRTLYRRGPYIYCFDGKCGGTNKEIVDYINDMAIKFPMIKVFRADWNDKIRKHPLTSIEEMNKVFIYYNGSKCNEKYIPSKETINLLFAETVNIII